MATYAHIMKEITKARTSILSLPLEILQLIFLEPVFQLSDIALLTRTCRRFQDCLMTYDEIWRQYLEKEYTKEGLGYASKVKHESPEITWKQLCAAMTYQWWSFTNARDNYDALFQLSSMPLRQFPFSMGCTMRVPPGTYAVYWSLRIAELSSIRSLNAYMSFKDEKTECTRFRMTDFCESMDERPYLWTVTGTNVFLRENPAMEYFKENLILHQDKTHKDKWHTIGLELREARYIPNIEFAVNYVRLEKIFDYATSDESDDDDMSWAYCDTLKARIFPHGHKDVEELKRILPITDRIATFSQGERESGFVESAAI
ncbi:hypothetical protein V1522DRAFT_391780 [Lipomyces starkeyi]